MGSRGFLLGLRLGSLGGLFWLGCLCLGDIALTSEIERDLARTLAAANSPTSQEVNALSQRVTALARVVVDVWVADAIGIVVIV